MMRSFGGSSIERENIIPVFFDDRVARRENVGMVALCFDASALRKSSSENKVLMKVAAKKEPQKCETSSERSGDGQR